jgi:hypothetical protein
MSLLESVPSRKVCHLFYYQHPAISPAIPSVHNVVRTATQGPGCQIQAKRRVGFEFERDIHASTVKRLSLPRDALINQYMVIYHQKINDEKMEIFPNLTQTTYPLNTVFLYGKYYLCLIYFGALNTFQYSKDQRGCALREK